MDEQIVLVDNAGNPTGVAPKLASHHAETPLHLAFSCYIFDEQGKFLLTQRAKKKKVWPGVWTNSVCGHPAPKEKIEDAIARRLKYELGLNRPKKIIEILPDYRYKTPPFNGIVENEICPVYVAVVNNEPQPNPDEVEAYRWLSLSEVISDVKRRPRLYSYWLKDELKQLAVSRKFRQFLKALNNGEGSGRAHGGE